MAPLAPTKIRAKKEKTKKQNVVSDVPFESSAEPKTSKTGSKPSPAIVPSISSTKPSKEKKPAQKKPELPTPTSISRPRSLQSGTVMMMGKKSKKSVPEPESSSAEEDDDGDQDEDDDDHLHGFSTDDDDSSDEEDPMDDEPSAFDVGKLPTIAKDDATVKRKLEKAQRQPVRLFISLIKNPCWFCLQTEDRGVLFIGRLPHGFYEDQLRAYFSQFGNVTRLRVSRNKKVS